MQAKGPEKRSGPNREVRALPKVLVSGRGGSGKSTLVSLMSRSLSKRGPVLVVDADESNLGLPSMLGVDPPTRSVMDWLGGKGAVREKLFAALRGEGRESPCFFESPVTLISLPRDCLSSYGNIYLVRIGKIEHSMEGCACPMGALARGFLKSLWVDSSEWVLVDTEAGIEHFGRGVLEGVDTVLLVVDPSREAVILAEKAARLCREADKPFLVVGNRVDTGSEPILQDMLLSAGLHTAASFPYSPDIAQSNLEGSHLGELGEEETLRELISKMEAVATR
ncbi:zeta toxin family protein [Candidatus Solincola tengchongensis]|uniref:ATP-binding protein n=1 Tax=Candidatus Solincola tengchongensis TaxID=2900693 RepID=UPI00257BC2DB|nr:zeta toxin family protein [Candidatus Solincola tengchongensis]